MEVQDVVGSGADAGVTQQPPRRRRKVSDNPEVRKRKAEQNRLAQRAFRERKDLRIKELEMHLSLLSRQRTVPKMAVTAAVPVPSSKSQDMDILVRQIRELQDQVLVLQSENHFLRDVLTTASSVQRSNEDAAPNLLPLSSNIHQSSSSVDPCFARSPSPSCSNASD
ncbi:hypothetical protein HDU82_005830 [Entophlyctis luteolus]|nr:hypothetical protein HDU82_005830 [Entophlyctis luteolus]